MKKTIALLLAIMLVFCLAACGQKGEAAESDASRQLDDGKAEGTQTEGDPAAGNPVSRDSGKNYRDRNGLEINYIYDDSDTASGSFIRVSGLKNKDIENAINSEIYTEFLKFVNWSEAPEYEGINEALKDYDFNDPAYAYVDCYANMNSENILSVQINAVRNFYKGEYENYLSVSSIKCLNYDLNTGRHIKLSDVIIDGCGLEEIESRLSEYIRNYEATDWLSSYEGKYIEFTDPAPKLSDDTQFILNDYSNQVTIICDETTPWARSEYSYSMLGIDLDGISAIDGRFNADMDIYDAPSFDRMLLDRSYEISYDGEYASADDYLGCPGLTYDSYNNVSDKYPAAQTAFVCKSENQLNADNAILAGEYMRARNESDSPELVNGYISHQVSASRYGNYTNMALENYMNVYDHNGNGLYSKETGEYYCFRGNSSEPLALSDLFVPGSDVMEIIKNGMIVNCEWEESYNQYGVDLDVLASYVDEMLTYLSGFAVHSGNLSLYYSESPAVFAQDYTDEDNLWIFTSIVYSVPYEYLGIDNLTIFE